jgi:hypothetical protein
MNDAKCYPFSSKTLTKLLIETLLLFSSKNNMACKVLVNFTNISQRFAITLMKIWKLASEQWKHTPNNKELTHGSKKLLPYCHWTPRLTFKSHSGEWNTTWTLLELSIMPLSSSRSRKCSIISANITNLICSDHSWW